MIDAAEDRQRFQEILELLQLRQPPNGIATDTEGARLVAGRIGIQFSCVPATFWGPRNGVVL